MSDDNCNELLLKKLDLAYSSVMDTWKVYMTWFTFFFGANLIVMSWILTKPNGIGDSQSIRMLSIFWIIFNSTGALTSVGLSRYSYLAARRMESILLQLNSMSGLAEEKPMFPVTLSVVGALFNTVALIANIVAWSYIWCRFGGSNCWFDGT